MSLDNLPVEWQNTDIGQLVDDMFGGLSPKTTDYQVSGVLALNKGDIKQLGVLKLKNSANYLSEKFIGPSTDKIVQKNDVLVTLRDLSQKADFLGLVALYKGSQKAVITQGMYKLLLNEALDRRYLMWYSNSPLYRLQVKNEKVGATQVHLRNDQFKDLCIPLPPSAEQQEIVRQLDVMLAQVEQIKARLDAIPAILKKFRQSVLADAVSGKLTEEWRAQNTLKPIDISNIYQEHEKYFKDKGVKKYQKPNEISIDNHPYDLPNSWSWFRAEQLCDLITKGTTPSKDKMSTNGEVPYIKVYNLTFDGTLDFTIEPTFISKQTHDGELARSKVFIGDVLMNIVGPPLGKVSIVPSQYKEWNINQAISIFRPVTGVKNKYLAICLMDTKLLEITIRKAKATAGQSNLTLEICRDFPIPIPPIEEQIEIIELVNKLLGNASNIEKLVESAQKRVNLLTQSILAKAFSGELTAEWREQHQDLITGVNSAEALLAKIQAEREASKLVKKVKKVKSLS